MHRKRVAVISTGNAGQAMAGYFAHLGYSVSLYAREQERVDMFSSNHIRLQGIVSAEADVRVISCDMGEVLEDASLIMVTTPAQYHAIVARAMAPHLKDGQIVVLNPGRTFGTYVFGKVLAECGCAADVIVAETDTLIFTCRSADVGCAEIHSIKRGVQVAAHIPERTPDVLGALWPAFPDLAPAPSVLHTGLTNIGMVFHPVPILMNITRVEAKERFLYYREGISPVVANVLERLDGERVAVAGALGIVVPSAKEWLGRSYGARGDSLYACLQDTRAYGAVKAPTDIDTRYIQEDVPTGCVPVSCLGRQVGVKTPVIDSAIQWAGSVYGRNYAEEGRGESQINFGEVLSAAERIEKAG